MYRQTESTEVGGEVRQKMLSSGKKSNAGNGVPSVCFECIIGGAIILLIYLLLFTGIVYAL